MTGLPPAIEALDPRTLLGRWHIVATTLGFWRGRSDATVTYAERADGRWSDTLAYRSGAKARTRARCWQWRSASIRKPVARR